jgi:hypothetical protein
LVRERREGRHWHYELNPKPSKAVDSCLEQYRVFWRANLASLKCFVEAEYEKESRVKRNHRDKEADNEVA